MVHVKICGTTHSEDALFCDRLKVDFLGFIFHPDSPRFVEYDVAAKMIQALRFSRPVGVFVHHDTDEITQVAQDLGLWGVQVYQDHVFECPEFKVIRAHRMRGVQDVSELHSLRESPTNDYVLVDAYHDKHYGGTGQSFDWQCLPEDLSDVFLAGGIRLDHIEQVKALNPFAIDLVSGVERIPGRKDFEKLTALMEKLYDK